MNKIENFVPIVVALVLGSLLLRVIFVFLFKNLLNH